MKSRKKNRQHPISFGLPAFPAVEGGLLPRLLADFTSKTGIKAVLTRDDDLYAPGRQGKFDLLISHFGHRDTEGFVMGGFGLWPRTIFSNQLCLAGPASDPARVRGSHDLVTAFRKIAKAKAPYIVNRTKGIRYLTETMWHAAGQPAKGSWLIDAGASKKEAFALAGERKAYVIWGLTPFLREEQASRNGLVPLLTSDPILQRIMVATVVNPSRFPTANVMGATALQQFLLSPETQASILTTRYQGYDQALWAPAGRHNAGAALPI
ncbi:MAG TPA: hypothetical protein VJ550_09860 [Geomonas sp.]|nr:hypothetical protein [Geomonas sp.]